jgi:hypothetical protein
MITPTSATDFLSHPEPQSQPTSRRRARVMRTQEQWKALLEEFNISGLTKSAFCKKHRIATSSLYRWQQLSNDRASDADFIDVTEPLANVPKSHSVPVRDNDWQVELELGSGIVLRLRTT